MLNHCIVVKRKSQGTAWNRMSPYNAGLEYPGSDQFCRVKCGWFGKRPQQLLDSAQRTRYHKECDPRKRRCVVQEVGDHYGEQAATSKQVRNSPDHTEKRGREHDAKPREKALIQVARVCQPKRNAGHKDLHDFAVARVSEFGHQKGAKQDLFTESSGDSQKKGGNKVKSARHERI